MDIFELNDYHSLTVTGAGEFLGHRISETAGVSKEKSWSEERSLLVT